MQCYLIGSFPSPLYRRFVEKEYAEDFIFRGNFRLQPLKYYCDIEDKQRQDTDEGTGRLTVIMNRPVVHLDKVTLKPTHTTYETGPVQFISSSINPRYILCFLGPQADLSTLKYGQFLLRINEPHKLVSDIVNYLNKYFTSFETTWVECISVTYNKDQIVKNIPEPASDERITLTYSQKSPIFSNDCEQRLVVTLSVTTPDPPPFIKIELNKKMEYVEWVKDLDKRNKQDS